MEEYILEVAYLHALNNQGEAEEGPSDIDDVEPPLHVEEAAMEIQEFGEGDSVVVEVHNPLAEPLDRAGGEEPFVFD